MSFPSSQVIVKSGGPLKRKAIVKTIGRKKKSAGKMARFRLAGVQPAGPELKCCDVNGGGAAPVQNVLSTTSVLTLVNDMIVGAAFNQRLGRTVSLKTLHLKGTIFMQAYDASAALLQHYCRVAVVYDRQPNGAFPTYANIWTSVDNGANASSTVFDFPNIRNSDRFLILADEHFQFSPETLLAGGGLYGPSAGQNQNQSVIVDRYIKLNGLPTSYTTDAGAGIGDMATGALYVVTIANQAAADALVNFNWCTRLRYTDQ